MSRLYRLALGLVLLWTTLLVAERFVVTSSAPFTTLTDDLFRGAHNVTCSRMCLLGIQPGKTAYSEVEKILADQPAILSAKTTFYTTPVGFNASSDLMTVNLLPDQSGHVDAVYILFPSRPTLSTAITLGSLIATLGYPSSVTIYAYQSRSFGYLSVMYSQERLIATFDVQTPRVEASISPNYIAFATTPDLLEMYNTPRLNSLFFDEYTIPAWLGFASFDRYWRYPTCSVKRSTGNPDSRCTEGF